MSSTHRHTRTSRHLAGAGRASPHAPASRRAAAARGAAAALLALAAAPLAAQSQAIVSPRDRATLEGSSSSSYPLGRFNCRLQQLHADLGAVPRSIRGHAYRRDAVNTRGALSAFRVELSVELSISPRTPSTASRTFQENAGTPAVVLPRTWIDFPETNRPGQAPAPAFELRIPYQTPFQYTGGGQTLCVDTTVWANDGPNGANANFTSYQDAHEQLASGQAVQPGYRFGSGCAAPGAGTAAYASFELTRLPSSDLELAVEARFGMPTDPSGPGLSALLLGLQRTSQPWHVQPACTQYTIPILTLPLAGANDDNGHWNGVLAARSFPAGVEFYAQVASGHHQNGVALSDASHLVSPALGPSPIEVVRIAHASDPASPTGTVSAISTVTELF